MDRIEEQDGKQVFLTVFHPVPCSHPVYPAHPENILSRSDYPNSRLFLPILRKIKT